MHTPQPLTIAAAAVLGVYVGSAGAVVGLARLAWRCRCEQVHERLPWWHA